MKYDSYAPLFFKINHEWVINLTNLDRIWITDDHVTFFLSSGPLSFSYKTGVAERIITKDELEETKRKANILIEYFKVQFEQGK
jgi:hypothetical protein